MLSRKHIFFTIFNSFCAFIVLARFASEYFCCSKISTEKVYDEKLKISLLSGDSQSLYFCDGPVPNDFHIVVDLFEHTWHKSQIGQNICLHPWQNRFWGPKDAPLQIKLLQFHSRQQLPLTTDHNCQLRQRGALGNPRDYSSQGLQDSAGPRGSTATLC